MRITPLTELTERSRNLQQQLREQQLDAAILVQNSDLFYFTGSIQRGLYYLPAEGEPIYFVFRDQGRARMESGLCHVVPIDRLASLVGELGRFGVSLPGRAGMEFDVLPVIEAQRYQKLLPATEFVDIAPQVRTVRAIKSGYELEIMKDCALLADRVYEEVKNLLAVGKTDHEVMAELFGFALKQGHQGLIRMRRFNAEMFFGHIFSGVDSAVPAHLDAPLGGLGTTPAVGQGAGHKKIAAHEPIIVDFIIAYDGYLVDQTRTFSIGPLTDKLQQAYADMLTIQKFMVDLARPGVSWSDLYRQCYQRACELGYEEHFMGAGSSRVRFIGHGIGVEVDEYPFIAEGFDDQVLLPGMTFAFEPKAVFPGLGAVGVENTWRVAEEGVKRLTYSCENLWQLPQP
ncbi:M24 family metallopeptidase [Pelovirga terrestris]|uniref:Aminopeptidase P family protein n=1 Tax=Pelovirga terrestris TaxID=2771352 RepID=A0A8J6QMI2_9BACT|nr:Xaa-Pro peptidase family protein [Pelovirga terrestris]MBD1401374.1 aminopeptidase P family protein [Pelovirga terrestris]